MHGFPGDNMRAELRPEIIAQEEIILHYADALLVWMKREFNWTDEGPKSLKRSITDPTGDEQAARITHYILNKLDPVANQFVFELLRAAWHRRCWQAHYGERLGPRE